MPVIKYTYSERTAFTLEELDETQREQVAQIGAAAQAELITIRKIGDADPSYDLWVSGGDTGLVFPLGVSKPAGVRCVNGKFSAEAGDASAGELAKALNAAGKF